MAVIQNTWVEKQRKKKELETAPAFESKPGDSWIPVTVKKAIVRHTNAARAILNRTLRGIRK